MSPASICGGAALHHPQVVVQSPNFKHFNIVSTLLMLSCDHHRHHHHHDPL